MSKWTYEKVMRKAERMHLDRTKLYPAWCKRRGMERQAALLDLEYRMSRTESFILDTWRQVRDWQAGEIDGA